MVDTCAAEFAAETPYFYATYAATGSPPEAPPVTRPAALVIGSGPVRIGQGIEFDYCAVQAADILREQGWQAVMVNSNPETVSTDFDASSRLYFEPLDAESVLRSSPPSRPRRCLCPPSSSSAARRRSTWPRRCSLAGVPLPGADLETIDLAEERTRFAALVDRLGIPQPEGGMATSIEEALTVAERVGYPVIVRPIFVIGGLAIDFCYGPDDLVRQLAAATVVDPDRPVRIDAYLEGLEVDVDAVCDGDDVLIPGLMEHVERAGVHSGDSVGGLPAAAAIGEADQGLIVDAMTRIALAIGCTGLINAQFIVRDDGVYLLEVNPRASRTVPFLSKVTGVPMVELATRVALGAPLRGPGLGGRAAAAAARSSRSRRRCSRPPSCAASIRRSAPGMRSTGEVIGIHADGRAWRWPRRSSAASLRPPLPGRRRARSRCSRSPTGTSRMLPHLAAALAAGRLPVRGHGRARPRHLRGRSGSSRRAGHAGGAAHRAGEEPILDVIASGEVPLVVNTPSPQSGPVRDAAAIRLAARPRGSCASRAWTPLWRPRRRWTRRSRAACRRFARSKNGFRPGGRWKPLAPSE